MTTREAFLHDVRAWIMLHPAGLRRHHPPHQVNNLYFDSSTLEAFWDNKGGELQRNKARLRWYGKTSSPVDPIFEIKSKRGALGWKTYERLRDGLDFDEPWSVIVPRIREQLAPEVRLHLDANPQPTLINHYWREYYVTRDGRVRVTVDSDIQSYDQVWRTKPNTTSPVLPLGNVVIEVKGDWNDREGVGAILDSSPFRIVANSKYVRGVEAAL